MRAVNQKLYIKSFRTLEGRNKKPPYKLRGMIPDKTEPFQGSIMTITCLSSDFIEGLILLRPLQAYTEPHVN
jgi:hypothetical protein